MPPWNELRLDNVPECETPTPGATSQDHTAASSVCILFIRGTVKSILVHYLFQYFQVFYYTVTLKFKIRKLFFCLDIFLYNILC